MARSMPTSVVILMVKASSLFSYFVNIFTVFLYWPNSKYTEPQGYKMLNVNLPANNQQRF